MGPAEFANWACKGKARRSKKQNLKKLFAAICCLQMSSKLQVRSTKALA